MAAESEHVRFGRGLGTRRVLGSDATGGAFGLVEHDLPAGQLGSPVHTHEREDEHSYVLSGRLSVLLGDKEVEAGPGEVLTKPRGVPHAFWNGGADELRFLELITPGGFEEYFFDLAGPFNSQDAAAMDEVRARYRLDLRIETVPDLLARHGLRPPF